MTLKLVGFLFAAASVFQLAVCDPLGEDGVTKWTMANEPRHPIAGARHEDKLETNASRFARGLPPLAPSKSRRHHKGSAVRRQNASPIPQSTYHGVIQVTASYFQGYISSKPTDVNSYLFQSALNDDALRVTFSLPSGQTSASNIDIIAENSQLASGTQYPYLGLASGSTSIHQGSMDTAFLAGTAQATGATNGLSTCQYTETIESSIWTVDVSTGAMSLRWLNPDNSNPGLDLFVYGNWIYYGASGMYTGSSPVSLKFVPV